MKSAEGKGGKSSRQAKETNLKTIATQILKTMQLLDKPFGQSYLCQVLQGEFRWDPKHASHIRLDTFGVAAGQKADYLGCVFQLLLEKEYIASDPPNFNTLRITDAGERYLNAPDNWIVPSWKTKYRRSDIHLRSCLRYHRTALAKDQGLDSWLVFTNFTLEALVRQKPHDFQSLSKVPGMTTYKCEHFGASILEVFREAKAQFEDIVRASTLVKVSKGTYPEIQKMFMEGFTVADIASHLGVKEATVSEKLRDLHSVGKVDLIPWIEKEINSKELFKGAEYFKNVKNPSVTEAFNTLGIDYETLRYCKLYVADFKKEEAELAISA